MTPSQPAGASATVLSGEADTTTGPGVAPPYELVTMPVDELIGRLQASRVIGAAPRHELAWLAARGEVRRFEAGLAISDPSTPVEGLTVLLSGRMSIHVARGGVPHRVAEWRTGDVTGMLPHSRLVTPPGRTITEERTEVLLVPREHLRDLTRECYELTSLLVHAMLDRARMFTSTFLHDEKLTSLGRLAAGLAHELNNPAAAIRRSAQLVPEQVAAAGEAARALGAARLDEREMAAVEALRDRCLATPVHRLPSKVEAAEREEAVADWLETRGVDAAAAEMLAGTPLSLETLDGLAGSLRADVLAPVLRWLAADCSVRALSFEIEQAATRISDLVTAVRGFARVDTTAAPTEVDIAEGLAQTLAVLRGKARGKTVSVEIDVEPGLPAVRGVAAELNQIWANLLENAIDAAAARVAITARRDGASVVVGVRDDGPGIPEEIRDRIFDPFFTTKDVGQGTGLGLDIVRRLLGRCSGDIEVRSEPGRTEFIVSLPAAGGREGGRP